MILATRRSNTLVLRLMVGLALLGAARVASAQGTWSVISLPPKPGDVYRPSALAVDGAGNLYVADYASTGYRIQQRDTQGHWFVIATPGTAIGQVSAPAALAADGSGNLYVAEGSDRGIQKRDAQGNWSVIAAFGENIGQVWFATALAVDGVGNLYVAVERYDSYFVYGRIQKRDAQGNWSVIANHSAAALAVDAAGNLYIAGVGIQKRDAQGNWSVLATQFASALAADSAGNLYVADWANYSGGRLQRRDARGNWSVIAVPSSNSPGQVFGELPGPTALAVDTAGNLYVAEQPVDASSGHSVGGDKIRKRDAQGAWSVVASYGTSPGRFEEPAALAADAAGNLYVVEAGGDSGPQIQQRDTRGHWWVIATRGWNRGQIWSPTALATDSAGSLYVAEVDDDYYDNARIQQRDAQGNWSVIAGFGSAPGQVSHPVALATDGTGSLYVVDYLDEYTGRIQRRDAQGNWSVIAALGIDADDWTGFGGVWAFAADSAGNLSVADWPYDRLYKFGRIQQRDAQGNWSVIAAFGGDNVRLVGVVEALAADSAGNLYVADAWGGGRIQKRDVQGNWCVIATAGSSVGQVSFPFSYDRVGGLAVDGAGNLYVADAGNNRVLKYTPDR